MYRFTATPDAPKKRVTPAQFFREVARGGQAVAAAECAGNDRLAQAAIHLPEQRLAGFYKWYHGQLNKWLYRSTTISGMLKMWMAKDWGSPYGGRQKWIRGATFENSYWQAQQFFSRRQ